MKFTTFCTFVYDGDTIAIDPKQHGFKWVRLASIDAPEIAQQLGVESRDSLALLCAKREVEIDVITIDKYGRAIAQVLVDGVDASVYQTRRGMAFPYFLNERNQTAILIANAQARESKLGVWGIEKIVPPSQFRAEKKQPVPLEVVKISAQLPKVVAEEAKNQEPAPEEVKPIPQPVNLQDTLATRFIGDKPDEAEADLAMAKNPRLFLPTVQIIDAIFSDLKL